MTVSVTFKICKSLISDLKLLLRYGECACVWCQRSVFLGLQRTGVLASG